jgi:hypothetical protein
MAVSLTFVIFLETQPILDRSVRTVPELASVATNNDPVSDVSSTALPKHVWMAREKRGRRALSVVLTSARARASRMAVSRVCFALLPPLSCSNLFAGSQPPSATTTAAAIHAVAQYAPEGYYPIYYPPGQYLPPPHEGPDGSPPHPNGQHIMPYYIHPGAYPPFPHYPPMYPPQGGPPPPGAPHAPPPPPPVQPEQPQTINPADAARKADDPPPVVEKNVVETNGTGKKRSRPGKNGEPKAKKTKVAHVPPIARAEEEKEDKVVADEQTAHDEGDSDNSV